jgi:2-oxoglutarate ferredoxin oxidoreductase subunit alpha
MLKEILIPKMNLGQLRMLIRAEFLVPAIGLNKVQGMPFTKNEVKGKVVELLG